MIPEAAVEAAAKWMHDNDCRSALHSGFPPDFECYDWLDEARELLEAAAPHMLAEAWGAGESAGQDNAAAYQTGGAVASNPYRPNP